MEEIKIMGETVMDQTDAPTPYAGIGCGWMCYSGFLCIGGNGCN